MRILLFVNSSEDSDEIFRGVARNGYEAVDCTTIQQLNREISSGIGALVLGEKCLSKTPLSLLAQTLTSQPAWSHLPVLLVRDPQSVNGYDALLEALEALGNVTILERPLRPGTVITVLRTALLYRQRQYEMRDLMDQLEKSRGDAVFASRAKSDFLANMSHEIRTPLGAVLGFSELIMESGISEGERQIYMSGVKRNGKILSALIDDILDLAKVESGRIELESREFSFFEMLAQVISRWQVSATKRGLKLVLERPPNCPDNIGSDPVRLAQILDNVIGNAIKFTESGTVAVRVRPDDRCRKDGIDVRGETCLHIEVEDSGIGISTAQAAQLFRPFTQADSSTTRRFGGTGLGLVLSRKLCQILGGDLRLSWSVPDHGSCFEITVKVRNLERASALTSSFKTSGIQAELPLSGYRILVVDDCIDNQVFIEHILKLKGAAVKVAGDGIEGIEIALGSSFDVVLMDLQMPLLGGLEAVQRLRAKGYTQPIIALTAHALREDRMRCLEIGCTDYLTKPIERNNLILAIQRANLAFLHSLPKVDESTKAASVSAAPSSS